MTTVLEDINRLINETNKPVLTREGTLEQALQGIASCATQCVCCEMHRRIAVKALGYEVGITTDSV